MALSRYSVALTTFPVSVRLQATESETSAMSGDSGFSIRCRAASASWYAFSAARSSQVKQNVAQQSKSLRPNQAVLVYVLIEIILEERVC